MKTLLLEDNDEGIAKAAEILKKGGLVAFPTETVYGLGADALRAPAVAAVYAAKGRPSDNPMIVHIADAEDLSGLTEDMTGDMEKLMAAFWPGPMTMIVRRKPVVPDVTTGGLDTVGVRLPSNSVAKKLIRMAGCPVAAPSANLSGRPSPTSAEHVIADLDGRIDGIIVSGNCDVGIESTVVDVTGETPEILRPGIITAEDMEEVIGKPVKLDPALFSKPGEDFRPKAPGMKYKHYAPKAEMQIFEGESEAVREAVLAERKRLEGEGRKVAVRIFEEGSEKNAAHDLFAFLRQADEEGADNILVSALPEKGVGFSVMNRMLKSAGYNIRRV